MQDVTQAEIVSAVDAALCKVQPLVCAEDVQAVIALLLGMSMMAQRLESDMQGRTAADVENGDGG